MPTLCRHMSSRRAKRNDVSVDSTACRNGYPHLRVRGVVFVLIVPGLDHRVLQKGHFIVCFQLVTVPEL